MVENEYYFVLHAPRQSGKSTFIKALTTEINEEGRHYALECSLAALRGVDDKTEAINTVADIINDAVLCSRSPELAALAFPDDEIPQSGVGVKIKKTLRRLSVNLDKDLVVFFDEADCLAGPAVITFLAQIRDGYLDRHQSAQTKFPRSLALVGMRDIRDYLVQVRSDAQSIGLASPFNVKKESLTLANFTREEVGVLYAQHTEASGQVFEEEAVERAWRWTEGQPWLVNALAAEIVEKRFGNDYSKTVTRSDVDWAAETMIERRDSHIDSLLERLKEPKVAKVMDAVFAGYKSDVPVDDDDRRYCLDLGIVVREADQTLRPANKIYQEVCSRVLTDQIQFLIDIEDKDKFISKNILLMTDLLKDFQQFWRHNSQSFPLRYKNLNAFKYDEATYSFILLAYLQKVINSGGQVYRQFSEGRGVVDIAAIYHGHEYLIEVKLIDRFSLKTGLKQISGYLDTAKEREGWIVVFDRDINTPWEKKIFWRTEQIGLNTIHIVGC
jgi:hypothetical protein